MSKKNSTVSTNDILKSIIKTAVPFIIIGSGITLYQLIDQFTFNPMIRAVTNMTTKQIIIHYAIVAIRSLQNQLK
ncbi:hypothetical protein SAMN04488114_1431 [Carnobacterium iners]|nr:hypothetical protein SAMN04488114_1431 [Carnobacterium iners]